MNWTVSDPLVIAIDIRNGAASIDFNVLICAKGRTLQLLVTIGIKYNKVLMINRQIQQNILIIR